MITAICFFVTAALLLFPQVCAKAARDALYVWGLQVVPSLFPYMVFSKMLAERIRNTKWPPIAVCLLLGTIGGSPSGAALIETYAMRLSGRSLLPLCAFTGVISPMFFLGTVRSWTEDALLSRNLLLAQLAGALMAALCACFIPVSQRIPSKVCSTERTEKSPLTQSIDAVLQIGGCIICFSVIASLLGLVPLHPSVRAVLHAVLEISGGMHAIIQSAISVSTKPVLLAFVSSFSGLSILSQNLLFLRSVGVRTNTLLALSIVRAIFSALAIMLLSI